MISLYEGFVEIPFSCMFRLVLVWLEYRLFELSTYHVERGTPTSWAAVGWLLEHRLLNGLHGIEFILAFSLFPFFIMVVAVKFVCFWRTGACILCFFYRDFFVGWGGLRMCFFRSFLFGFGCFRSELFDESDYNNDALSVLVSKEVWLLPWLYSVEIILESSAPIIFPLTKLIFLSPISFPMSCWLFE